MADTHYAFFTFSLPEDTDSDKLQLFSSATEAGSYTQVGSDIDYSYGETTYEYNALSTALWYKIKFRNSINSTQGPLSSAVYGGNFTTNTPDLFVSTTTDGAYYATIQDVYDYSTSSVSDFTNANISASLRRARSIIDLTTAEMDLDRYSDYFVTEIARKKYNATLKIIKEIEVCFALAIAYRAKADDILLERARTREGISESITIGATSITQDNLSFAEKKYTLIMDISTRYATTGGALLEMLSPTSIPLSHCGDSSTSNYWYPFGWKSIIY